jgi:hypothetical protein
MKDKRGGARSPGSDPSHQLNRGSFSKEAEWGAPAIVAIAMVLPLLGIGIYGFESGWFSLGWITVAAMAILAIAYFTILKLMLSNTRTTRSDA